MLTTSYRLESDTMHLDAAPVATLAEAPKQPDLREANLLLIGDHDPTDVRSDHCSNRRRFGLNIHRAFAEAVAWKDGKLSRLGRVIMRRERLEEFAKQFRGGLSALRASNRGEAESLSRKHSTTCPDFRRERDWYGRGGVRSPLR
jgi:hypothetical protein